MPGSSPVALTDFLRVLISSGRARAADFPLGMEAADALGLRREGEALLLPRDWDPLDPTAIRAALGASAARWMTQLEIYPVIGSTNLELVERAQGGGIAGLACLAEVQIAGRGRRGRTWLSPLGGNLALSLGFEAVRPPAELGGLSLVVGLAVIDAIERCGVEGLALKWPNDILLDGAKLGGILIELVQTDRGAVVVIGVGINIQLPDPARRQLDQAVTDLAAAGNRLPGRSEIAARVISSIVDFEAGFSATGFGPFAAVFDRRHAFHDADITLLQGSQASAARVLGVAHDGGLRIHTASGATVVHGGEVSLRARGS